LGGVLTRHSMTILLPHLLTKTHHIINVMRYKKRSQGCVHSLPRSCFRRRRTATDRDSLTDGEEMSQKREVILLANLLQGSRSTFSCASVPSFFAFKEGMWDTQSSAFWSSPTVSGGFAMPVFLARTARCLLTRRRSACRACFRAATLFSGVATCCVFRATSRRVALSATTAHAERPQHPSALGR
jgi:hypothetical protein